MGYLIFNECEEWSHFSEFSSSLFFSPLLLLQTCFSLLMKITNQFPNLSSLDSSQSGTSLRLVKGFVAALFGSLASPAHPRSMETRLNRQRRLKSKPFFYFSIHFSKRFAREEDKMRLCKNYVCMYAHFLQRIYFRIMRHGAELHATSSLGAVVDQPLCLG